MIQIDEHIGQANGILNAQECQDIIDHWEKLHSMNLSWTRAKLRDATPSLKKDTTVFALEQETMRLAPDQPWLELFLERFWDTYSVYLDHYDVLRDSGRQWIRGMRIQKTEPGEGYHAWHFESDGHERANRVSAWMIYLNDDFTGGETEFLYQHKRVEPEQGKLLIWPAAYTHVHRGNTPLEGTKYILTGWCEW